MDNMQILYIFGAFVLGLLIAWFAGRGGPKRALEESEANAQALKRSLDDRNRTLAKLEAQVKEQTARLDRVLSENSTLATTVKSSEEALVAANDEAARLQAALDAAMAEQRRLTTELSHAQDAWSGAESRLAELSALLEESKVETALAEEAAEEIATLALTAPPPEPVVEVDALKEQVASLQRDLVLARAAAARMAVVAASRPVMTDAKRSEYVALSKDPEKVISALHTRDVALSDARSESDFLRRNLSTLTAAGAELSNALNRRNSEYTLLLNRLSELTATDPADFADYASSAASRSMPVMAPVGLLQEDNAKAEEDAAAVAARDALLNEQNAQMEKLQANLSELQAEIDGLTAVRAVLEEQLVTRNTDLTEVRNQLADLDSKLQVRGIELDELWASIAEASSRLGVIAEDEDARALLEEAAAAEATASAEPAAAEAVPPDNDVDKLKAGVGLAIAAYQRKHARLTASQEQLGALSSEKDGLQSTVADSQAQIDKLQRGISDRSVRFDALSLRASGLESDLEIAKIERSKNDDQILTIAAELNQLAAQYDDAPAAPVEAAPATPAPVAPLAELAAAVAAVGTVIRKKVDAVAETGARMASLETELSGITADKDLLASDVAVRSAEVEQLQASLTELEAVKTGFESDLSELGARLNALVAEFGTPAPAEAVAAISGEATSTDASATAVSAEAAPAEPVAATPSVVAREAADAVALLLQEKHDGLEAANARVATLEDEIGTLTSERTDLESNLSDITENANVLQSELGAVKIEKASLEEQLKQFTGEVDNLLGEYGDTLELEGATRSGAIDVTAADGEQPAEGEEGVRPAVKVAGAASLGTLLKRQKEELEAANAQVASLQAERDTLSEQITALQTELEGATAAKAALESDAVKNAEAIVALDAQVADLQTRLADAEASRAKLEGEMQELDGALADLESAIEANDPAAISDFVQRYAGGPSPIEGAPQSALVAGVEGAPQAAQAISAGEGEEGAAADEPPPVVALASLAAVAAAIQKRQSSLEETNAQLAAQQQLLDELTAAETRAGEDIALVEDDGAVVDETQAQYEAMKQQLDNVLADRDSIQALLAERNSELTQAKAQLTALRAPPPPKQLSDFKAAARATATALGVDIATTTTLQDLATVQHIGTTYAQRLYRSGVGTYWELTHLKDDDLQMVLKLTEMQMLAVDFNDLRADARRQADESNTVGLIWEGDTPDDFEPIQGIGKVFEQRLYDAGIRTYKELANTSEERLAEICKARKPLVPNYGSWIRQARQFMEIRGN